jgi:hypothetical protein
VTLNESVELLFRIRAEGAAEVDRLANSVREVSGSTALANTNIDALERSLGLLTATVSANTTALLGLGQAGHRTGDGLGRAADGATRLAGSSRTATTELRMLEGAMPVRAAGAFLSQLGMIGPLMQAAFPVFGLIAVVGVLDTILEKTGLLPKQWNAVTESQKESLSIMDKQSQKYTELLGKLKTLQYNEYERAHGKQARQLLEAEGKQAQADVVDTRRVDELTAQLGMLRRIAGQGGAAGVGAYNQYRSLGPLSESDAYIANMALPGKSGAWGLSDSGFQAGVYPSAQQAKRAHDILPSLEWQLSVASLQKQHDTFDAADQRGKVSDEEKKKGLEEQKKYQQELLNNEKAAHAYLEASYISQLTGLQRITAEYQKQLDLHGKSAKAIADINAGYGTAVMGTVMKMGKDAASKAGEYLDADNAADRTHLKLEARALQIGLRKEDAADEKYISSGIHQLQASDAADAFAVRAGLSTTLKQNMYSARSGGMTAQGAASADYQARVAAANEILRIESQHLDLYNTQEEADRRLSDLRKRRAEEVYHAEAEYENQLQALREKDLDKYRELSGSLFDALQSHSLSNWGKDFAMGQFKTVAINAAAPALQQVGHTLGGLIPASSGLGSLLHGTVLDPANKGVADAATTAKATTRTADEVKGLRADLRAMPGAPAAAAGDTTASGITVGGSLDSLGLPNSTTGGSILGGIFAVLNPSSGKSGTGLGGFMGGMGMMGTNPFQAAFTGQSTDYNGGMHNMTGAQQAGAAVAMGGMLFSAGMAINADIQRGGAKGATGAISTATGTAAMLDPEPISKTILGTLSVVSGIVGTLLGDPKEQRLNKINEFINKNQYLAPTALNVTQGVDGTYLDFDARGNLRTSTMSAVPTVAEPYITSKVLNGQRQYYDVSGNVVTPYSGTATGTGQAPVANGGPTLNFYGPIQAMDANTFQEFIRRPRNSHAIGESLADHLERHDGRASNAIRYTAGG